MPRHKIFLLDAMALLYRAHFAFVNNPRRTSKGMETSALFGFANTLLEIIKKENPSHLGVAFDLDGPTFRHEQFGDYKGHRQAMPEALAAMIPYTHRFLEVLDIPILELPGYEADDIIGAISAQAPADTYELYLVTPDKDYAQLVKENVFLYRPRLREGGFDIFGEKEVIEKFGVPPAQITDYLGLTGDASDNIPGIPKVGEKTALELLRQFGSMETIIERADEISKASVRESVKQFAEQGRMSKQLATIQLNTPIEWTYEKLAVGYADLEALSPLMEELEFRSLTQRILNSRLNPHQTVPQTDLFGNPIGAAVAQAPGPAAPQASFATSLSTIETAAHRYVLADSAQSRAEAFLRIRAAGYVCFDTETTSLNELEAELVGISLSVAAGEAWYLPCPAAREATQAIVEEIRPLLEDPAILKIGQNIKYDMLVLKNYGLQVQGPMFDTMLAHYVLKPEGKHGMDAMSRELLGYEPVSIETLIGKKGKNQLSMRDVEVEKVKEYAAEDADVTFQLYQKLEPQVKGNPIFESIEMPLVPVLAAMEREGIRVDVKFLEAYSVELAQRMEVLEKEIHRLAGSVFNINSPKQLGEILFDRLGLGKGGKAKKTATGQYSTDEQALMDLAVQHELPAQVLAYRSVAKLKSTYVDALPQLIQPQTGRVHTTFRQTVAVTGRLSSENPNLQNIPIRSDDGREVRKAFVPRNADFLLLSADYSQVELRIMASLSGDENMIQAFREGMDIHRATAARVFGVNPDEVSPAQRSAAKTVNFGIIYGISAFGLSQRMGISRAEAKDIIDTYFERYPGVKAYMEASVETARSKGYVETLFGRRRSLPDIHSANATVRGFAERNAINSPIQGTAADIIKIAMIRIDAEMRQRGLQSRMLLQVHDELVFDVYRPEEAEMKELVRTQMAGAAELAVPLEAEAGVGENWLEAH